MAERKPDGVPRKPDRLFGRTGENGTGRSVDSMNSARVSCLILACGNPLRGDDGVGPWLAEWAAQHFRDQSLVRVRASAQWTPELAEEIAQ
jgi:hypothetical protein